MSEGYLAVDLFFMLSGFVIALNYNDKIISGLGVTKFFQLRLLRLYPTYFVGAVLGIFRQIGGVLLGLPHSLSVTQQILAGICAIAMLPFPYAGDEPISLFPLNNPSWSLFLEFVVNIAFAFVLFRLSSRALLIA